MCGIEVILCPGPCDDAKICSHWPKHDSSPTAYPALCSFSAGEQQNGRQLLSTMVGFPKKSRGARFHYFSHTAQHCQVWHHHRHSDLSLYLQQWLQQWWTQSPLPVVRFCQMCIKYPQNFFFPYWKLEEKPREMQSSSEKRRTYWQGIALCWKQSEGWYTNFQNNFQAASVHHRVCLLLNSQWPSILSWFLQKTLSMSLIFCTACRCWSVGSGGSRCGRNEKEKL